MARSLRFAVFQSSPILQPQIARPPCAAGSSNTPSSPAPLQYPAQMIEHTSLGRIPFESPPLATHTAAIQSHRSAPAAPPAPLPLPPAPARTPPSRQFSARYKPAASA